MLEDEDVRCWFDNLAATFYLAATVYLRNLGFYCEVNGTDLKGLLKVAKTKAFRIRSHTSTRSGLEVFGWEQVVIDLNAYAGQSIYIYFEVANTIDANYKTWCYIDDVSVTYATCDFWCIYNCVLNDPEAAAYCTAWCAWRLMAPRLLILHAGYA